MKREVNYWRIAMYFVLFEFTFWTTYDDFGAFIFNLIFYQDIISFNYKVILSFFGILISIFFFKQFIKNTVSAIKTSITGKNKIKEIKFNKWTIPIGYPMIIIIILIVLYLLK